MASQWSCKLLGQEVGPVSFREMAEMVRAGTLKEDDPVRRQGTSEWTRAREVIGLFRVAAKEPPAATPKPQAEPQRAEAPGKPKPAALHRTIRKRDEHFFDGTIGERREEGGYVYRRQKHDTSSEALSGWMRIVRAGNSVRFQIAGPHAERFTQIREAEFPPDEVVKVMFKAQTRGSPTAVDVVWSCLDVQAEKIIK
jgi:hypothetical protein